MHRPFALQSSGGDAYVFLESGEKPDPQFQAKGWDRLSPLVADTVINDLVRDADGTTLRRIWRWYFDHSPDPRVSNRVIANHLIRNIERGDIVALRWVPKKVPQLVQTPPAFVRPPDPVAEPQRQCDWKLECQHHKEGKRPYGKYKVLQVVPERDDFAETKWTDTVKVHYKETPQRAIVLKCGQTELAKKGAAGGYQIFELETEMPDDNTVGNVFVPRYWDMFMKPKVYEISGAAEPIRVEVFNPHTYKFEFSLPPFRSQSFGAKLEKGYFLVEEGEGAQKTSRVEKRDWTGSDKAERTGWSKSKLGVKKVERTSSDLKPTKIEHDVEKQSGTIALYRDGSKLDLDILSTIGAILKAGKTFGEILKAIKEAAPPRVGFYFDAEMQFMQGKLAIEWGWKEFEDHTAYHSIDFNIQLTIISASLEVGFGLQACACKAQIYLKFEGDLSVSADACIEDPHKAESLTIPASATFNAALGIRIEVGNLAKVEGKGESGIKIQGQIGIHRLDRRRDPKHAGNFSFDLTTSWTGLKVSLTASVGLFGVSRDRTLETVLADETELGILQWPSPQKYEAPDLSRDAIAPLLLEKITEGWNLRVIREKDVITPPPPPGVSIPADECWTPEEIADALATTIVNHTDCSRTHELVNGLGVAIRADLDVLGKRDWYQRDYVSEKEFILYLKQKVVMDGANGFRSVGLQARLDALIDPSQKMAQQLAKKTA